MSQNNSKLTSLSDFGEFGLIERLTKGFEPKHKSTVKGIGDDAAVLEFVDLQTIVTTDILAEGVHFNLTYTPLKHLGYKAVAVNLSDIYAMNATPKQITVSIAVSNRFTVEALDAFYEGIKKACEVYHVDLVGGDTSSSVSGMVISITAIGTAEKGSVVYRNTARENQLICVSGDLGAAYMGLQLLEREKELFKEDSKFQPKLEGFEYILERQLKPEPRADIIRLFKEWRIVPTAMMDISDGLSSELLHICKGSDIGCKVFESKLPIEAQTKKMAKEMNMDPTIAALNGGEDYELLFTLPTAFFDAIKDKPEIRIIGQTTAKEQGMNLVAMDGTEVPILAQGWNSLT